VAKSVEVQTLITESKSNQEAKIKENAELTAKLDAAFLAAAELKAKQDAEAKAAAEKLAAAKATAQKKTTIICVKGKLIKKVTAVKPKCPSGFKKK
jgi:membrane protein involved in colicin uptake